eukprot:jgi/Botrbrau1/19445/Bobra.0338s0067.1
MVASTGGCGSVKSSKSSQRKSYRTVSRCSQVDETLFSSPTKKMENVPIAGTFLKGASSLDATVLNRKSLENMRKPAETLITEITDVRKKQHSGGSSLRTRKNQEAITAMLKDEELRQKEGAAHGSDEKNDEVLLGANLKLDEQLDEVKRMNQMVLFSKCMAERDKQLKEKEAAKEVDEDWDRKMDLVMEIERIRALNAYEERERRRAVERKRGAEILAEQLAAREVEKLKAEERRELEREAMVREMERLKEVDSATAAAKVAAARQLIEDVALSNAVLIQRRQEAADAEAAEDARIAAYLAHKDIREQAAAVEKARIAREKDLEVARLRARQEKVADRRAEIDELRARRWQQQKDRELKAKDAAEAARAAAINAELAAAREQQKASALAAQAELAMTEEREFRRILAENRKVATTIMEQEHEAAEAAKRFAEEQKVQIAANAERRRQAREENLQEGARLTAQLHQHRRKVEAIRQRKLKELREENVPEKYSAELSRKKFS